MWNKAIHHSPENPWIRNSIHLECLKALLVMVSVMLYVVDVSSNALPFHETMSPNVFLSGPERPFSPSEDPSPKKGFLNGNVMSASSTKPAAVLFLILHSTTRQ